MGVKSWFKRKKDNEAKVETVVVQENETNNEVLPTIDIESSDSAWMGFLVDSYQLDEYKFFKKLGFPDGDKIKITSTSVSEEIKVKVDQWITGECTKIPKRFFKIISAQKGEFILGVCYSTVVLLTADLAKEKKYDFNRTIRRLISEKDVICHQNMQLEIVYEDKRLTIICKEINENNRSLQLELTLENRIFEYFDTIEETEDKVNNVREKSCNITNQLLALKEIPNNENNDGIIKLLEELELEDFFGPDILLKKIVLTSEKREDIVIFCEKRVENYIIKDLEQDMGKESSRKYGFIENSNYSIETNDDSTVITLSKITKDVWMNGINLPLSDFILEGMNEQKAMDELLMHVDRVLVKRLETENK